MQLVKTADVHTTSTCVCNSNLTLAAGHANGSTADCHQTPVPEASCITTGNCCIRIHVDTAVQAVIAHTHNQSCKASVLVLSTLSCAKTWLEHRQCWQHFLWYALSALWSDCLLVLLKQWLLLEYGTSVALCKTCLANLSTPTCCFAHDQLGGGYWPDCCLTRFRYSLSR